MSVSGFTFIKSGLSLAYPIKESIESISDFCDEVIINIGFDEPELKEDDGTEEYLRDHFQGSKYKFLKSYWDPKKRKNGEILAEQTNIALRACTKKYCQYIQGDEAIHESDQQIIIDDLLKLEKDDTLDGLVYQYIHFYGSPNICRVSRNTYRKEVRLIKNNRDIVSFKDAQGFRAKDMKKLFCTETKARIFHYGWARSEMLMDKKHKSFHKLYHQSDASDFNYQKVWGLKRFTSTHPQVMKEWIQQNSNDLDILSLPLKWEKSTLKFILSDAIEKITGIRLGEYQNYRLK